MQNTEDLITDWSWEVLAIVKVNHLQQEILQTSNRTNKPGEALAQVYERLTDEQKIAFILAGGAASLFRYQEQRLHHMRTGRGSSDIQTGQLPVVC